MKVGMRTPNLKKSVKARTTGKAKRAVKKAVVPGYGKKGMGLVNDPKKAAYNKVYNKATVGIDDILNDNSNVSKSSSEGGFLDGIIAIFQFLIALVQLVFYIAVLVGIVWLVIQVIKVI